MLKSHIHHSNTVPVPSPLPQPPVAYAGNGSTNLSSTLIKPFFPKKHAASTLPHIRHVPSKMKTVRSIFGLSSTTTTETIAVVNIQPTVSGSITHIGLTRGLDDIKDVLGYTLLLELVAAELDPNTGMEKERVKGYAKYEGKKDGIEKYRCEFKVPEGFGEIGGLLVENEHHKEIFLKNIVIDDKINITCESWVHSKYDNPDKRIFFTDKSYLPSETPNGLKTLRDEDLQALRGDGTGERKAFERIYDYDFYNDLGDPDSSDDLARPVLGGKEHPYPRRCRTGRPHTKKDPMSETRSLTVYVPRDEDFSEIKEGAFGATTLASFLRAAVPTLNGLLVNKNKGFPFFTAIDLLYNEGVHLPKSEKNSGLFSALPSLIKAVDDTNSVLLFNTPETLDRDKFSWFRDEDFCRQTIAGLNPYSIKLVTEWPLKSKLDPAIYGPAESAITKEIVELQIRGFMTIEEAIKQKKLFMLDYHDLLLPYVNKVREIEGTTLYGSRTLMFLSPIGTLRPLAIELTRPPGNGKPLWRRVYTPSWDATGSWLWKLAKAQVLAHDSGYHQLISHWLLTHCVTEPYIIATNRQLSRMHPIQRLLCPYLRYTMQINALAREALINAKGIIETSFSPDKYCMELSSDAYDQIWRFDQQALPADLISRGMAVEDETAPYGLKLTVEDYPFANDGLLLWEAIENWVRAYVNVYYPKADLVESDEELQAWWTEIRTVGHADKKDEPWWPELKVQDDLIKILSTIIWVTSCHHSAVNFGQYDFAGYIPNRPTIIRTNMPDEDPTGDEWQSFIKRPEDSLMSCFPTQIQATKVMAVLNVLSSHSPDEEYIGTNIESAWEENSAVKAAFDAFSRRLKEIEKIIDDRNVDPNLKNRCGAGVVPYQLLKLYSEPGVTGKGVPNSISI